MSDSNREKIAEHLEALADDLAAAASRARVSETIAAALARVGNMLWVSGYFVGPDRVSKASPFGFGDDGAVGVATVAQIGGELGAGAVQLLRVDNRYAAAALVRQLVEVEYLAHAFAEEDTVAAEWLRASRDERRAFWSPARLRERASDRFLPSDYWHHCELGGHPASRGLTLLPNHRRLSPGYLWVDLAGHLVGIWSCVLRSTERFLDGPVPDTWTLPDVADAVEDWHAADQLHAALGGLSAILRDDPDAFDNRS